MFEVKTILERTKAQTPLVHCITNFVTVNDVANVVLASGGSPVMADEGREARDICAIAKGLVINTGTLNATSIPSMLSAGKMAGTVGIPAVLDPVGMRASEYRTEVINLLLDQIKFDVIKGNASEIKGICKGGATTKGVDADASDEITDTSLPTFVAMAKELAQEKGVVVGVTGAIDIITDGEKTYIIRNGHPTMAKITGTGCMISGIVGSYCGANKENYLEATTAAIAVMGIAGEIAYDKAIIKEGAGNATMRNYIIDAIYTMTPQVFEKYAKVEEYE